VLARARRQARRSGDSPTGLQICGEMLRLTGGGGNTLG
jgi:hypothetical protein